MCNRVNRSRSFLFRNDKLADVTATVPADKRVPEFLWLDADHPPVLELHIHQTEFASAALFVGT